MDSDQLRKKRDRELIELLNELRVALPGVQVLFAFLLIAPFSARFENVTSTEKSAYMVSLLATLVATVLLIAPSAYHRLRWRERDKERMLRTSNRLAIAGLAFVAIAMTSAVFLVTDLLLADWLSIAVTAATGLVFLVGWFVLPLSQPYERWDESPDPDLD